MATEMFIKLGSDIKGEATADKRDDWIVILDYDQAITQAVTMKVRTGGVKEAGGADFTDFRFTKALDKASPLINKFCSLGTPIPTVDIEFCTASGTKHIFMKYTLENVIISGTHISIGKDEDRPTESVSLSFGTIKWVYTPIDDKGAAGTPVEAKFDLQKGIEA